jgi:hypothetical protein
MEGRLFFIHLKSLQQYARLGLQLPQAIDRQEHQPALMKDCDMAGLFPFTQWSKVQPKIKTIKESLPEAIPPQMQLSYAYCQPTIS